MQSSNQPVARSDKLNGLRRAFWARAERLACFAMHHALKAKAKDQSADIAQRSALVLAPHADDETLGCGGVIALKRNAGTDVTVAVATDGSASHRHEIWSATTLDALIALRETETLTACKTLGVNTNDVRFLKQPDGDLAGDIAALTTAITTLLHATRPDDVFVCAERDGHPDHTALAQATHLALQDYAGYVRILEYPVWCFDFRSWRVQDMTNTKGFVAGVKDMLNTIRDWSMISVRTQSVLHLKKAALAAHQSQLGTYDPEPQWSGLPDTFTRHFLTKTEIFRLIAREDGNRK
ncbi:LmbE family N-acetylglucosaminyl deacetylase [Loktanella ponticola]|uniref:LmbE family N-acetylglucosaminyl deacetylase n=1 Tax=Yoonia ponticola TaxID=1524255 RepID=A0A7W9BJ45_9RHOB|nr:PIG-L deacetylase family protein [Yoonia ponticola]MBB5721276.1 LmbE family N-acetylglucosaminyl deacetylase [Yoonia ponticola]